MTRLWIGFEMAFTTQWWLVCVGLGTPMDPLVRGARLMLHVVGLELVLDLGWKRG